MLKSRILRYDWQNSRIFFETIRKQLIFYKIYRISAQNRICLSHGLRVRTGFHGSQMSLGFVSDVLIEPPKIRM